MKSDTRIAGPWAWPEPLPQVVRDPLHGNVLYDWQQEIIDIISGEPDDRKIYWYWEPDGCAGKTSLIKHILLNHDASFFQGGKKDIAYAYKGQKVCIFGFSKTNEGKVSYDAIESLQDGLIFSSKYESSYKIFNQPHIICFANWPPEIDAVSADRWVVREIRPSDV